MEGFKRRKNNHILSNQSFYTEVTKEQGESSQDKCRQETVQEKTQQYSNNKAVVLMQQPSYACTFTDSLVICICIGAKALFHLFVKPWSNGAW